MPTMNGRLAFGSPLDGLLERLYAQHVAQDGAMAEYFTARAAEGSLNWNRFDERTNEFLKDKLVALDRSKAEFCYHVCRALRARRSVEAGIAPADGKVPGLDEALKLLSDKVVRGS